jgi:hypothetical protein
VLTGAAGSLNWLKGLGGGGDLDASIGGALAANGAVWKGGFQPFAAGGMVDRPTLGLVGEGRYNEAIVPLPDGRSIPVEMRSSRQAPDVHIEVNNNSGTQLDARKGKPRFEGGRWVVGVWLDAYRRDAYGLRSALGGV